ncbi:MULTISPECIES: asparagine synthase-related protein [Natrialbaceae]|uniref:asparagine synthase-related protein n=1 Tax=Natrialbaceae TaxID=1644061 RepID=UPI00207D431C|nr:asparagine synthase-related protein [Natronococcus sp. CG52]
MVGLGGHLGAARLDTKPLTDELCWNGHEQLRGYSDDDVAVSAAFHDEHDQPAVAADGEVLLWAWGELYGFEGPNGYLPRSETMPNSSDAEYCAALYDQYGLEFVHGLNGEFAGVVYERTERTVSLFTDRLSSRPLSYARSDDGSLVFSTFVQSIVDHPAVETDLDLEYLCEFFGFERVLGVKTPFEGIENVHPGSILTYDLSDQEVTSEVYWRPKYEPNERPYSRAVDELVDLFRQVMAERVDADEKCGLLLSGGSDSRLMLAALDHDVVAYHMNEYMNAEATIARRVADIAGVDFEFLERDAEYQERILEQGPSRWNFASWFDQAHTAGFSDRLRDEQDIVFTGLYADTFLSGFFYPQRSIRVPILDWTMDLPYTADKRTVRELAELFTAFERGEGVPEFVTAKTTLEDCVRNNVDTDGEFVTFHGVEYPSLTEMVCYQNYPLSSDGSFLMYETLYQTLPTRDPFLDNRLVDFSLRLPVRYLIRRDIVDDALTKLDPDLAAVPHPETGIGLQYPWTLQYLLTYAKAVKDELFASEAHPGPWTDRAVAIRETDFVIETIRRHESTIRECPFLDYDAVLECYRDHLAGADRMPDLYPLLTILEAPASRRLLARSSGTDVSREPHLNN